ncbi:UDP-2,3-diacylglucosamine diphosphatase [Vibrio profundum]|uniref:UDP-2,3-diacylglucosamine diphosphatase n=1 Tax=Vibrio profundum TaxID=2910247 RepID=UPI003D0DA55E
MTTLFIADLHLSPSEPDITRCFLTFMREEAIHADALYVLGDLFEFWIGDDDNSDFANQIRLEIKTLTQSGIPCYFVRGNRDFLIGRRFAKQTGITLLEQESLIDLYGTKAVILHGDTLCTQDVNYLKFRKKVHQPWLQWLFNRIPLWVKKKIIAKVQSNIRVDKQTKSLDIMDVTPSEVDSVLEKHHVDLMIHGHTHRPNIHTLDNTKDKKTRVVLGDWYTQGSVLVYDENGYELQARPFN